jgi:hypothetical protein
MCVVVRVPNTVPNMTVAINPTNITPMPQRVLLFLYQGLFKKI